MRKTHAGTVYVLEIYNKLALNRWPAGCLIKAQYIKLLTLADKVFSVNTSTTVMKSHQ